MGAAIALKSTFTPGILEDILCFMDDSSNAAICGTGKSDIANLSDLNSIEQDGFTRWRNEMMQPLLYEDSGFREGQCSENRGRRHY